MSALLRKRIRAVVQQCMLEKVVVTQRSTFLQHKAKSLQFERPLPSHFAQRIEKILTKERKYPDSVRLLLGKDNMEATIPNFVHIALLQRVAISFKLQVAPSYYQESQSEDGFPSYYCAAVLSEKYRSVNICKVIAVPHLTSTWKEKYASVSFPAQHKMNSAIMSAQTSAESGEGIQVPK